MLFTNLLLSGKLDQHMAEIDRACVYRMELLTRQMVDQESVNEALKAADQFEWVRRMNSIQNRAEEIVLNEFVYCWRAEMQILENLVINTFRCFLKYLIHRHPWSTTHCSTISRWQHWNKLSQHWSILCSGILNHFVR